MSQLALGCCAPGLVAGVGDELDRVYTPDLLARAIVDALPGPAPFRVVEPSVGGGAFVRAARRRWPRTWITGVDRDGCAAGLLAVDQALCGSWPEIAPRLPRPDLILGNPPFGGDTALSHVEAALGTGAARIALILPWAYWGVERWASLLASCPPVEVRPILPRPWPDRVRETALYLWERGSLLPTQIRPLRWGAP